MRPPRRPRTGRKEDREVSSPTFRTTAKARSVPPTTEHEGLFGMVYRRVVVANAIGAALAFVYLSFVSPPLPPPPHDEGLLFLGVAPLYFLLVALVGYYIGRRDFAPPEQWLREERAPTDRERHFVFSGPWRAASRAGAAWLGAAVLFGGVTATHHPAVYVAGVVIGILLAGLTSTAITFLLIERTLRPAFAVALGGEVSSLTGSRASKLVRTRPRLLASWALGSGIALIAIPLAFLGRGSSSGNALLGSVIFLVVAGLFGGGVLITAAATSVAEPLDRLRKALRRVEEGSLDEEVRVDDGGELGLLEAGFNRMVSGLRERERIREAFGTYLDSDVAEHILREGTSLSGEEVEVTILVLDIRNFTRLAERLAAPEVVTKLNRLFERLVPIVHTHGGHVDKYVGDGLLAVFGAPRRQANHAEEALSAAIEIATAVEQEFAPDLSLGIGLNSGTVVAGNVGGAGRLEFSVIGDAVNVAARVEAATRSTGDVVLIAERTRQLLGASDVSVDERPGISLKGKREAVSLYAPRLPVAASTSALPGSALGDARPRESRG
jgi:adenylate cyclase